VSADEKERDVYGPTEVPRPHSDCPQNEGNEIVVCAPAPVENDKYRLGPQIPQSPTAMEQLSKKLEVKLGPVTITPADHPKGGAGIGAHIKF
jgi:hypothetical protein